MRPVDFRFGDPLGERIAKTEFKRKESVLKSELGIYSLRQSGQVMPFSLAR
jgi:hypothetical protein